MVKFICKKCNYKFEAKENRPVKCPYCDSKGSAAREQTAEEILGEVEE